MDTEKVKQEQIASDAEEDIGSSVDFPAVAETTLTSEAELDVSTEIRGLSVTAGELSDITHGTEDLNINDDDEGLERLPSHSTPVPGGFYSLVAVDNSDAEEDDSQQTMTKGITADKIDPIYEKDIDESEYVSASQAVISTAQPTAASVPIEMIEDTNDSQDYQKFQRPSPSPSLSGSASAMTSQTETELHTESAVVPPKGTVPSKDAPDAQVQSMVDGSDSGVSHPGGTGSPRGANITHGSESNSDSAVTHPPVKGSHSDSGEGHIRLDDTSDSVAALEHGTQSDDDLHVTTEPQGGAESSSDSAVAQHCDIGNGSDSTIAPDSSAEQGNDSTAAPQHDSDTTEHCMEHDQAHISHTTGDVASNSCSRPTPHNGASILEPHGSNDQEIPTSDTLEKMESMTTRLIPSDDTHTKDTEPHIPSPASFAYGADDDQSNKRIRSILGDSDQGKPDLSTGTLKSGGQERMEPFVLDYTHPQSGGKNTQDFPSYRTPGGFDEESGSHTREESQYHLPVPHDSSTIDENQTTGIRNQHGTNDLYGNKISPFLREDNALIHRDFNSRHDFPSSHMYQPQHNLALFQADTNRGHKILPFPTANENIYENVDDNIDYDSLEDDHVTSVSDVGGFDLSHVQGGNSEYLASIQTPQPGYKSGVNSYMGYDDGQEDNSSVISDVCTGHLILPGVRNPRAVTTPTACDSEVATPATHLCTYPGTSADMYPSPSRVRIPVVSQTHGNLMMSPYRPYTMQDAMLPGVLSPGHKLEHSVLRDSEDYILKGDNSSPSAKVPARIREIITRNLAGDDRATSATMTTPTPNQLAEENKLLSSELNRVEDLLAQSRAERDELGIKYNALSERLEQSLKGEGLDGGDQASKPLVQQNIDLRRKLEEEHNSYKRKLQAYQDGQQRQAQLVQKLQAKLLQYKKKCQDLETMVRSKELDMRRYGSKVLEYKRKCAELEAMLAKQRTGHTTSSHVTRVVSVQTSADTLKKKLETAEERLKLAESDHAMDLETALIKLEEEQQRSASLSHVNGMLREQLDQATIANQSLTSDIQKLTQDWQRAREELEAKEAEWRDEERSFNEYFSNEHGRLLSLWRAVVSFRRQFNEMKMATERDMSTMRSDMTRSSRSMHSACLNFSANVRNSETQSQVSLDRERGEKITIETQYREKVREVIELQTKYEAHSADLNSRINELTMTSEKLKVQLEERGKTVSSLQKSISQLESRVSETGNYSDGEMPENEAARQIREDTDVLHAALRDIAQAVINDADQDDSGDGERLAKTFRERSLSPTRPRSPRLQMKASRTRSISPRGRSRSPAFADATFSAVQAALNKRQLQVQELRAKLNATRDQNTTVRKQMDEVENERKRLEYQVLQLKDEIDIARREREDSSRDRDRIKNVLSAADTEKSQLEKLRMALNEQIEALTSETEKLQMANAELQQQRDQLEDEKDDMTKDKERQIKENERCHRVIEQTEQKVSNLKEELVATKEAFNRALLDKEVLEQQRTEVTEALSRTEVQKAEVEVEINKVKADEASLRDAILKMQALNEGLGQDKIELNKIIMQLEAEYTSLLNEKTALEQEKLGMREELVRVEQEKMDLDTEKMGLNQTLELSEMTRQQLEDEIQVLVRDKADITEQLNSISRQKQSLAEELISTRRDVERQSVTVTTITKEKEILTQDKGELVVQLTAAERSNRQQSETIASLTSDKESLESSLYEANQTVTQLETRKEQLEGENQELLLRKENLQGEIQRLLQEKEHEVERLERQKEALNTRLLQTEKDLQLALAQEKQAHEEDVERLSREKENQRLQFESEREEMVHQNAMEKEDMLNRMEREQQELNEEILSLQRERDDQLLIAENDKQQALSLVEQEKSTLQEKLNNLNLDLENSSTEYDRLKREALARQEQDKLCINSLNSELRNFRVQFEESTVAHEKEVKDLTNQIRDVMRKKESALKEVAELKVQLKMVEEARDNIRRDLIEANRKIREGEEQRELMRKDIMDLKRSLNDETREKETINQTANDLRNKVKQSEAEKIELSRHLQDSKQRGSILEEQKAGIQKEAGELRSSLREVEKARLEARRELQELRRQIKQLDGERSKLGKEVVELQSRVARDEEKEEESRRASFDLKQKVVETEASREALRKELANLQRKMAELIDESRVKEKDYMMALEDSRRSEHRLEEQRRVLEGNLENSSADIADLKMKLSGTEGRVNALEATLARLEGAKRDVEFKLSSVVSSLRRTIGFRPSRARSPSPSRARSTSPRRSRPSSPTKGFDNTYTTTTDGMGNPIPRTGSPERSLSRSGSPSRYDSSMVQAADVDPEAVRLALRDFVNQLATAERERDDAVVQVRSLCIQLKELEEDKTRTETRLQNLQKNLGAVEEDKRGIDGRLASAQTALMLQEETIRRNERERKALTDKVSSLEHKLTSLETEKRQLTEKLNKQKQTETKLDDDKKQLKQAIDDAENRCTKIELSRRSLEGELQRMRLVMNDKETENQVLQERVDGLNKQIQDLEGKAQSLQLTIDRLGVALAKTEEEGHSHKDKVQALNLSLSDSNSVINELEERVTQLQRALTSSEHDRRVLQERLDTTRQALNEAKKQNHSLLERLQTLQAEMSETEVRSAELEGQLRQNSNVLVQRQESEQELNQRLSKLSLERQTLQETVISLQRQLGGLETEKKEMERSHIRLEKDKSALRKTLDKVEREKMRTEEIATKNVAERGSLDRHMQRLEDDNVEMQRQIQQLQAQLAEAEQQHAQRLIDLTTRHRSETEMETERLRTAQIQAERTLEARERSNRQKVKGLEEQINTLKDQLSQELRKRQSYISRSARTGDEIKDIRNILDNSLSNIARDPSLDPILLDQETRKLDDSLRFSSPTRLSPRHRSPVRKSSPARQVRITSTPTSRSRGSMRRSTTSPSPIAFRN